MIKLTSPNGNDVWIRPDSVDAVMLNTDRMKPGEPHNTIRLWISGRDLLVKESQQEVLDKLDRRTAA